LDRPLASLRQVDIYSVEELDAHMTVPSIIAFLLKVEAGLKLLYRPPNIIRTTPGEDLKHRIAPHPIDDDGEWLAPKITAE
jgi:hypothetical protein